MLWAGLSALAAGGLAGFAAADGGVDGLPSHIAVPGPRVGDAGEYRHSVVRETRQEVVILEEEQPFLSFEAKPPSALVYPDASRHEAQLVVVDEHAADDATRSPAPRYEFYDLVSGTPVATGWAVEGGDRKLSAGEVEFHRGTWRLETLNYTLDPAAPLPTCGLRMPLQGRNVDATGWIRLFPPCRVGRFAMPESPWQLVERVPGTPSPTYVFVHNAAPRQRVWVSEDVPVPLQFAFEREHTPGVYDLVRLAAFNRGRDPYPTIEVAEAAPPLVRAAPEPWGPAEAGTPQPFPLSEAFARAREAPGGRLGPFLREHPEAFVEAARLSSGQSDAGSWRYWVFVVADGAGARLPVGVLQETPLDLLGDAPAGPTVSGVRSQYSVHEAKLEGAALRPEDPVISPAQVPEEFPSLASLQSRWEAWASYRATFDDAVQWGFRWSCPTPDCPTALLRFGAIARVDWGFQVLESHVDVLFDDAGRAHHVARTGSTTAPITSPKIEPWGAKGATSAAMLAPSVPSIWNWPSGAAAAAVGLLGFIVGFLYWAAPLLKSAAGRIGAAVGLYSRLEPPALLEHPVRARLLAAVTAQPGIHYQALARAAGIAQGVMAHHIAKLLEAGILARESGPRYTCFFLRGQVDRRLMTAAPILKCAGARAVLRAVARNPGASAVRVAEHAGLHVGTVSYHVQRLAQVGLLVAERAGRRLSLKTTEAGSQSVAAEEARRG